MYALLFCKITKNEVSQIIHLGKVHTSILYKKVAQLNSFFYTFNFLVKIILFFENSYTYVSIIHIANCYLQIDKENNAD